MNYSEKPGGYSGFQVTRMIEWGQKSKPKKKIPGPKINPPKNPMPNFQNLKISRKQNRFGYTLLAGICASTTTNLQVVLNTPKIPAKLSHPKNFDHPCHLKFRVPPLGQMKRLRVAYQPVALFCFCFCFFFPQTDDDPPHSFSQTFQLFKKDTNNYFVLNDMFRLSLHHG